MTEDEMAQLIEECAALLRRHFFRHPEQHPEWKDLAEKHKPYWREPAHELAVHVVNFINARIEP